MRRNLWVIFFLYGGLASHAQTGSNDHIFPAAAAARTSIDCDGKGFLIHGKRTFLVSAGLEYARVPQALWHDRLLRLKRAGFNCVEIYTFWNWHEPREGVFDFAGDHDLEGFLKMAAEMGLYVIARVGPYYCAEWDNGGYPLWLRFKPGVEVRKDNASFLGYVDRFFDRLMPIIARNQINHGGSVIMVQLENEHNDGWGTYMPNGYFTHLREKALALGMEVPYFFSGLHHASDPAGDAAADAASAKGGIHTGGDAAAMDDTSRHNPWFSTEFWSVWYNQYGAADSDARVYERRTWKIIAHGGGGYNYYMAYGGTNFGYTNNDEDAASYDYGAAVGQAGDLRPIYYSFKRMAWFARSFQAILSNAVDGTAAYDAGEGHRNWLADTGVRVTARHSPAGDLGFFDNASDKPARISLGAESEAVQILLAPGEIFPVVHDFSINAQVRLVWAPLRILGVQGGDWDKTIVVYGDTGAVAHMEFGVTGKALVVKGAKGLTLHGGKVLLDTRFPGGKMPGEYIFTAGAGRVRVLVMSRVLADRTWFIGEKGMTVVGPSYAGELVKDSGKTFVVAEERVTEDRHRAGIATVGSWRMARAAEPIGAGFNDGGWLGSEWPLQMGADGDGSPDAWYRTSIKIDSAGAYVLQVEGGDRGTVFIDGKMAVRAKLHDGEIPLQLSAGQHELAIFTAHDGRDKLAGYIGDMSTVDSKGLTGKPRLERGIPSSHELGGWKFLRAADKAAVDRKLPSGGEDGWVDYTIGKDVFSQRKGFGWFRAVLPAASAGTTKGVLKFRSVDENATVFINGRKLISHEGWNIPFQVDLAGLDTMRGPIELLVFMENYSNEGGIDRPVRVNYFKDAMAVTGWRMRGGIAGPGEIKDWKKMLTGTVAGDALRIGQAGGNGMDGTGVPTYYRAEFSVPSYGAIGDHPIWRVRTDSLGHGSVWVNGHNLGRYPEKVSAPGMYIPECWLKGGVNELVIYDEDGRLPVQVRVEQEVAAGRTLSLYKNF